MLKGTFALLALVAALLVSRSAVADDHNHSEAQTHQRWWSVHLESETEFALTRPTVAQIFTGEFGVRASERLFLTASALVHCGDMTTVGGGLGLRYESPAIEALGRVTFDHRIAEFPENAIRAEARLTWWPHAHAGVMIRVLGENFPTPLNRENGGEWDFVAAAGPTVRWNHHLMGGLLLTGRLPDATGIRHPHLEVEPGLLLLVELAP